MSRVERRKQATRKSLVAAARRLFSRRGIYEVRIEDLASDADIGKGTVYLYFRDRDALLRAALEDTLAEMEAWVRGHAPGARKPRERVRECVRAYASYFRRHRDVLKLFHQTRGLILIEPRKRRILIEPIRRHIEFLAGWLAPQRTRGAPARARQLAVLVLGGVAGVESMSFVLGGGRVRHVQSRLLEDVLGRGFERRAGA